MDYKWKITLAAGFVGAVGLAATALGQPGGGSVQTASNGSTVAAASASPKAQRAGKECGGGARIGRRLARIVHSDTKINTKNGFATITVDTGKITSTDPSSKTLTITRADNETVTATASDATKVCKDGKAVGFGDLKVGDLALIVQGDRAGTHVVRRIGVRTPGQDATQGSARPTFGGGFDAAGDIPA